MFQRRTALLAALTLAAFVALLARLARLQTIEAADLADELSERRVRVSILAPARGRLLDAKGRVLAEDRDAHDLWLVAAARERRGRRWETVSRLSPLSVERLRTLGRLRGAEREAELALAADALARENPVVAYLADALPPPHGEAGEPRRAGGRHARRAALARRMLAAATRRRPGTDEGLREPARFLDDVGFAVFDEVLQRQAGSDASPFHALRPRLGKVRHYPQKRVAAHLVGYVSELEPAEYEALRGRWVEGRADPEPGRGYLRARDGRILFSVLPGPGDPEDRPTDEQTILQLRTRRVGGREERAAGYLPESRVGRAGLEQYYNEWLRGRHVRQAWWYDRRSPDGPRERVRLGPVNPPRPGRDVHLSLDLDLQRRVEEILEDGLREVRRRPGNEGRPAAASAVVMDPETGRLFALASAPGFDPNLLGRHFTEWLADPSKPLRNHAVGEQFQPGSVMKPFVAVAAMQHSLWGADDLYDCPGVRRLPGYRRPFRCMNRHAHGPVDIPRALMVSCNLTFWHLAELDGVGSPALYNTYVRFGFGRRTGIDLADEAPGLLPRRALTNPNFYANSKGYLYHLAIGQNETAATPLQVAVAYAALANATEEGARIVVPHLAVPGPDGAMPDPELERTRGQFAVDRTALATVRQGLYMVVQGDGGTALTPTGRAVAFIRRPGDWGLTVAAKTGSAEEDAAGVSSMDRGRPKQSHAWFAAYAPAHKPQVVVVVMVKYGDLGGRTAGPLTKRILAAFFADRYPEWVAEPEEALG